MSPQNAQSTRVDDAAFVNSEITDLERNAETEPADTSGLANSAAVEVDDSSILRNSTHASADDTAVLKHNSNTDATDTSVLQNNTNTDTADAPMANELDSSEALAEMPAESDQSIVYVSDKFDDEEKYIGIFYNGQNEKKTSARLVFIVVTMMTLLLLFGFLAMMYTSQSQLPSTKLSDSLEVSTPILAPLSTEIEPVDSIAQTNRTMPASSNSAPPENTIDNASIEELIASIDSGGQQQNNRSLAANDVIKPLSVILSSRVALISSKNPKFIVTAAGQKIVPTDIINGEFTVVDIFPDYVLVSSNGTTQALDY